MSTIRLNVTSPLHLKKIGCEARLQVNDTVAQSYSATGSIILVKRMQCLRLRLINRHFTLKN